MKGAEVVDPMLVENITAYHSELRKRTKPPEEVTDAPIVLEKETPTVEEEINEMKGKLKRMSARLKAKTNCVYDFWERTGEGSGEGLSDGFHDPVKFDGDG